LRQLPSQQLQQTRCFAQLGPAQPVHAKLDPTQEIKKIYIYALILIFLLTYLLASESGIPYVAPDIAAALKKNHRLWKKNRFLASYSFRENVLFKESPPSIMVTRNPNWSTEILWYGTSYVKGKILSPLKRSA